MVSFFKLLGIGYLFAVIGLVWELLDITLHQAATRYVLPFTITAFIGFVIFFLMVYFSPSKK
ncbi:oxidase [Sulfolobus acidocaldarius SUSAZ]|nr:oxidase [Sulfolobus acidocaldarius SUSAZ]